MTRQTWTAFVSAFVFVGLAILLVVVPVPFVSWSPGGTRDTLGNAGNEPIIKVQGIETYPTSGQLDMTIVSITPADARLSLPQALLSYWLPNRDTLPRDAVYAPGKSAEQVESEDADLMETAQDDAVVAALRADGQPVTEMPAVYSVTVGGPAHKQLLPGDLVVSVDGVPTADEDDVRELIRKHKVGEKVTFVVIRDKVQTTVTGDRPPSRRPRATSPSSGSRWARGSGTRPTSPSTSASGSAAPARDWSSRWRSTTRSPPDRCWRASTSPAPGRSPPTATSVRSAASRRRSPEPRRPARRPSWSRQPTARISPDSAPT